MVLWGKLGRISGVNIVNFTPLQNSTLRFIFLFAFGVKQETRILVKIEGSKKVPLCPNEHISQRNVIAPASTVFSSACLQKQAKKY